MIKWHELAEIDDYLTRNLIDNLFFWIKTRKLNKGFQEPLNVDIHMTIRILNKYVISPEKARLDKCVSHFTKLPQTQQFLEHYEGDRNIIMEFKRQARRYFEMYLPECGFEMMTSDRYEAKSGSTEGAIVAKKEFLPGDEIKFLTGTFSELKPEEEDDLDKSDFSVIHMTSRANPCLMLGPSRFINHDCDSNAKFSSTKSGMRIFATKKILVGEEVTVSYANSYFGKDNKDCLCATCERTLNGSFNPDRFVLPEDADFISISSEDEEIQKTKPKEMISNALQLVKNNALQLVKREPEPEPEPEPEVILLETESETEPDVGVDDVIDNEHESTPIEQSPEDEIESLDVSPVPIDPQDFDKTAKPTEPKKKIPSIVSCMHAATDSPFEEPESEQVGGRRLRPREKLKKSLKSENSILKIYPKDDSIDSLVAEIPHLNKDVLRQRQINRTLHKLQMTKLYREADKDYLYDCRHCGIYFLIMPHSRYKYQEYCQRCARHQLLYGLAWPETRKQSSSGLLVLNSNIQRPPLSQVELLDAQSLRPRNKPASHGGVAYAPNSNFKKNNEPKKEPSKPKKKLSAKAKAANMSDYFTNSSNDNSDSDTPEVLPLGKIVKPEPKPNKPKNNQPKDGIKRVAHLKRIRETIPYTSDTNGNGNGKVQERILHVEDRGDGNNSVFSRSNSEIPRQKFRIVKHGQNDHKSSHSNPHIRRVKANDSHESDSNDSAPTKDEIMKSRPKISPDALKKEAERRQTKISRVVSSHEIEVKHEANGSKSRSRSHSEIVNIDEETFAHAKQQKLHEEQTPNGSPRKKIVIPEGATVVNLDSDEEDDIVPVKPFKTTPQKTSPYRNGKYTSTASGIHRVNVPQRIRAQQPAYF
ncbi:Histone-lysine N-methyltransferase [Wickerhamomyces ciferrii]|uniref:Histone-lysine N-methyltransferase SET9 n=1 Tax=Wickerhamomyces ciferrii (strain ATCC 14091 / BCRC 22168 / CBS 111 / JCM 3599 / NBRC 0793 / NRRL Y-1031 F-60-10) TaxID=1206466 RepID=K0KWC8_WICCF|nr:Histone-lysine N-methyltransferase [Wickerhamomyces ciferrii]CCH45789.1 Histone-lysine N-methyltransferase [Wickerhamomyces ciferrii]